MSDRKKAIETLKENLCAMCAYGSQNMESCDIRSCDNRDAIKALEQEPVLDKIFCIVHPLSIMSTPELEHKAIIQIAEMLEPLCLPESEDKE